MSPIGYVKSPFPFVSSLTVNGLYKNTVSTNTGGGVAPVINLKPEYVKTLIGDGTINNPYRSLLQPDSVLPGVDLSLQNTTSATLSPRFLSSIFNRGNVDNNYVKFGDFYWRIIRINGDGSLRIIYDGVQATSATLSPRFLSSIFNLYHESTSVFKSELVVFVWA